MEIEEFLSMSEDEQKLFQENNRKKLEHTKQRLKAQKSQIRRWIERGKIVEDFVPNALEMDDEQFQQKLWELIYQK